MKQSEGYVTIGAAKEASRMFKHRATILAVRAALYTSVAVSWAILWPVTSVSALDLSHIKLPPGFEISVFARVPQARSLAQTGTQSGPGGPIFVGSRSRLLHVVHDADGDGVAEEVTQLSNRLNVPNGLAVKDGQLFMALNDRIVIWNLSAGGTAKPPPAPFTEIFNDLPQSGHHGWRYAKFGPDGKLYVSVGSPCNICEPEGLEGTIIRLNGDGSGMEVVARGVRNSVGFDWHPVTGELWFTDNGADGMGDDLPPDELNRVTGAGQHFGFPYFGGRTAKLTGYETASPPGPVVPAAVEFQAHTAPLGMTFYSGTMFPGDYRGSAFVAQHGSWNRSEPVGYRVMRVKFNALGDAIGKEVFADGWLTPDGDTLGRPVDITELPDGSLLVSDDFAGVVYRVVYTGRR